MDLDQTDLLLLYSLSKNARSSYTNLGEKLNLTSSAIKYRIQRLIDQKIIRNFTIKIDKSILAPNFQAYFISIKVNPKNIMLNYKLMKASRLFERVLQIASSSNLIGITIPLSTEDLKRLIETISNDSIEEYSITPIMNDYQELNPTQIYGENISDVYCPECQEEVKSDAFIDEILGKEFAFCCRDCHTTFAKEYAQRVGI